MRLHISDGGRLDPRENGTEFVELGYGGTFELKRGETKVVSCGGRRFTVTRPRGWKCLLGHPAFSRWEVLMASKTGRDGHYLRCPNCGREEGPITYGPAMP